MKIKLSCKHEIDLVTAYPHKSTLVLKFQTKRARKIVLTKISELLNNFDVKGDGL